MKTVTFTYPMLIKEIYMDMYGHMNNAAYLTLFEEARWDIINKNGYSFEKIKSTGLGPIILEVNIKYLKELRLRETIIIQTKTISYENRIGKMSQEMLRGDEICCQAVFTFALFDLTSRKLVNPTADWLKAVGIKEM